MHSGGPTRSSADFSVPRQRFHAALGSSLITLIKCTHIAVRWSAAPGAPCQPAAAVAASGAATMSDSLISSMYAVGNVASSVALVLLNKRVFAGGFYYPMTLSCFHFAFTIIFYQLLAAFNVFSKPAIDMPQTEKFKVAFAGFASIGFMNLSLSTNSVGFYQVRLRARARARARVS